MPFYTIFIRIKNQIFLKNPIKELWVLLFSLLIFLLIFLFCQLKLVTVIDEKEIRIIFKPFTTRVIKWSDGYQLKLLIMVLLVVGV